jgi:hypothetical protein
MCTCVMCDGSTLFDCAVTRAGEQTDDGAVVALMPVRCEVVAYGNESNDVVWSFSHLPTTSSANLNGHCPKSKERRR